MAPDGTTLSSAVNLGTHAPGMTTGLIQLGRDANSSTRMFKGDMEIELRVRDLAAVSTSTSRFMRLRVNVIH